MMSNGSVVRATQRWLECFVARPRLTAAPQGLAPRSELVSPSGSSPAQLGRVQPVGQEKNYSTPPPSYWWSVGGRMVGAKKLSSG